MVTTAQGFGANEIGYKPLLVFLEAERVGLRKVTLIATSGSLSHLGARVVSWHTKSGKSPRNLPLDGFQKQNDRKMEQFTENMECFKHHRELL